MWTVSTLVESLLLSMRHPLTCCSRPGRSEPSGARSHRSRRSSLAGSPRDKPWGTKATNPQAVPLPSPLAFTALLHVAFTSLSSVEAFRRLGPSGQRQESIQALLQGRGRENVSDSATEFPSESLAIQESSRFVVPMDLQDRESAGDEASDEPSEEEDN